MNTKRTGERVDVAILRPLLVEADGQQTPLTCGRVATLPGVRFVLSPVSAGAGCERRTGHGTSRG